MNDLGQFDLHPDADQLNAFMENALPVIEQQQTLAHLAVCPDCRAVVAFAVAAMPESAPAALPDSRGVADGVAGGADGVAGGWRAWLAGLGTGWRLGVPAMACALLLAFAMVRLHQEGPSPAGSGPVNMAVVEPPSQPALPAPSPAVSAQAPERARKAAAAGDAGKPVAGLSASQVPSAENTRSRSGVAAKDAPASIARQASAGRDADRASGVSGNGALTEPRMAAAPAAPAMQGIAGGTGIAVGAAPSPAPLVMRQVAVAPEEVLPSHLGVLSRTASGARVVAIDAGNQVFASSDRGRTWTAVKPPWPGRALRVEGVQGSAGQAPPPQRLAYAAAPPKPAPQGAGVEDKRAGQAQAQAQAQMQAQAPAPAGLAARTSASAASKGSMAGGSVHGQVADATGAAIPQATVTLHGGSGAPALTAKTDSSGKFKLDGVAPGGYQVQADAPGFAAASVALEIKPGATSSAALTLPLGSASQTVEVSSDASVVTTDSARTIDALLPALPKRSPMAFTVTTDRGEHWSSTDGVHWAKR